MRMKLETYFCSEHELSSDFSQWAVANWSPLVSLELFLDGDCKVFNLRFLVIHHGKNDPLWWPAFPSKMAGRWSSVGQWRSRRRRGRVTGVETVRWLSRPAICQAASFVAWIWEAQMQSARTGNLGLHSTRFQCTSADSARHINFKQSFNAVAETQKLMGSCSALMGQGISCKDFQRICPKSCNELVREPTLPHCWTVVLTFDEARDEPAMRRCTHFSLFSFFFPHLKSMGMSENGVYPQL